VIQFH